MAPAIECRSCGFKVKTATGAGTEEEMTGLMDEYAAHAVMNLVNSMNLASARKNSGAHPMDMKYYENTPEEGFESAKVITGITEASYHSHK